MVVDVGRQEGRRHGGGAEKRIPPHNPYWPYAVTKIGQVTLDKAGKQTLSPEGREDRAARARGLTLASVELVPAR